MTAPPKSSSLRAWLSRVGASLLVALVFGLLTYLLVRGATGVLLFVQQQQFLREVAGAFQGGIEGLPAGDLRAVRLRVQELDARNERLSLIAGFVVAALSASASYLWLERRAAIDEAPAPAGEAEK